MRKTGGHEMKFSIKDILWLLAMGLFYTGVGVLGYSLPVLYILACFFGVPYSLYVYKKGTQMSSFVMPVVVLSVLIFTVSPRAAIMLILLLLMPSFVCGIYYHKQKNLPKNIIMLSIAYLSGWIGLLIIWNFAYKVGIISRFYSFTNFVENQYLSQLSKQYELLLNNLQGTGATSLYLLKEDPVKFAENYSLYRLAIKQSFFLIRYLFPAFIFIGGFLSSIVQVLFTKLILKALKWESPKIKDITNIGFTPLTVGLLGLTWLIRNDMDDRLYPRLAMAMDNVLIIFAVFMFIVGVLFTIHVIKNAKAGARFKAFMGILSFLSIIVSPFLFVILGFLEGIFNFRKTERFL